MELVSWGLLLIPVVILVTSYFLGYTGPTQAKVAPPPPPAAPVSCDPSPKISTPESISIASKIISDNNLCKV